MIVGQRNERSKVKNIFGTLSKGKLQILVFQNIMEAGIKRRRCLTTLSVYL